MIFNPIGPFLVGALAIALAAPVVVAAALERPPAARVPGAVTVVAALWAAVFLAAAVEAAIRSERIGVVGLFVAAAEILVAGVIWALRSRRDDGGGGGGGAEDPSVPPEYWARWEASLSPARRRR